SSTSFCPLLRRSVCSTLFPYTTLFRSVLVDRDVLMDLLADSFPADSDRSTGDPALAKARVGSSSGLLPLVSLEQLRRHRPGSRRSEEHTSELQSREKLVCRLLLEKNNP